MMRFGLVFGFVAIAACTVQQQDEIARNAAKQATKPVLAEQFPGVPLEQSVDCVIDNATADEILTLAADAVTGPTASTAEMVAGIAVRPGTIECFAEGAAETLLEEIIPLGDAS